MLSAFAGRDDGFIYLFMGKIQFVRRLDPVCKFITLIRLELLWHIHSVQNTHRIRFNFFLSHINSPSVFS